MKNKDTQQLAVSVYIHAMRKQIEEEVKSRYLKRIEYLVGANNELMNELEQWERVGKRLEKPLWKTAVMKEGYEEGGVDDGDGIEEDAEEHLSREEFDEQVLAPEGIRPMSQRGIDMWEEYNNQF